MEHYEELHWKRINKNTSACQCVGLFEQMYLLSLSQVHFGEPISFLQRMSEDLTYSDILDRAAVCDNTLEEVAHVAAFIASSYRSTFIRVNKPFNPMLGETFECDRRAEHGWRVLLEQVKIQF